jgi:hypothetical protein
MAQVYVHLSSRDIENKILAVDGVKMEEEPAPDPMAPVMCPRCKKANPPDARYCVACSMTLSDEAVFEQEKLKRFVVENPEAIIEFFQEQKEKKAAAEKT